jgi:hypothetical protein
MQRVSMPVLCPLGPLSSEYQEHLLPEVRWLECEADDLSASRAEAKNAGAVYPLLHTSSCLAAELLIMLYSASMESHVY